MNNTFSEGDLVEATNPEGAALVGRLGRREDGNLYLGCYQWTFPTWIKENAGFDTIRVVEKAETALPTEPGWYLDGRDALWNLQRNAHGNSEWFCDNEFGGLPGVAQYGPFTRLEPVADTARKVLDALSDVAIYTSSTSDSPSLTIYSDQWKAVASRFGVTS